MTESPLVSVLMTNYNREKYIGEAIESVLASSYENFELIIVDDISKDKSMEIAQSYADKDSRVKLFYNEKNLGDYPNRNQAAKHAQGKYLKYVDADDLIYPWGLEILVKCMEEYPTAGYGLCTLPADLKQKYPILLSAEGAYQYNYFQKSIFGKAPLSAIIKKEVFDEVGGFSEERFISDDKMWHRLSQDYSVVLMPDGITWWRMHDDQESSNDRQSMLIPFKHQTFALRALNDVKCPLNKEDKLKAIFNLERRMSRILLRVLTISPKEFKELKSLTNLSFFEIVSLAFQKEK